MEWSIVKSRMTKIADSYFQSEGVHVNTIMNLYFDNVLLNVEHYSILIC
jgi:hypothetical protein